MENSAFAAMQESGSAVDGSSTPLLRRFGEAAAQVLLHPMQADDHR
jgi:hypothetical protein